MRPVAVQGASLPEPRAGAEHVGSVCFATMNTIQLHSYFRSSAAYRVRIALNLKGLAWDYLPVNLRSNEQSGEPYAAIAPSRLVPLLETDGERLSQSMAIIEYLDEQHPTPPLLPPDALGRARVRALAQMIGCDIHPLNNLRVLRYLVREMKVAEEPKNDWYRHWVRVGLEAFERQLAEYPAGRYCWGDTPTLADCCLAPQIYNAERFECDLSGLPRTMAAYQACMALDAFQRAHPSQCPDAE